MGIEGAPRRLKGGNIRSRHKLSGAFGAGSLLLGQQWVIIRSSGNGEVGDESTIWKTSGKSPWKGQCAAFSQVMVAEGVKTTGNTYQDATTHCSNWGENLPKLTRTESQDAMRSRIHSHMPKKMFPVPIKWETVEGISVYTPST